MKKGFIIFVLTFLVFIDNVYSQQFRAVLEPRKTSVLSSEVPSTVLEINKRMGENFEKGDILMTLDKLVFAANYKKAKALVARAEADYKAHKRLYRDRVVSDTELREKEADLATAQADLILAKKAFDSCDVRAPYSGKVVKLFVKEFERVEPGQNLIEILDDNYLIAKLLLPEQLLNQTNIGDEVILEVQETGIKYTGKILRIGAIIDPVSSLFKVDAEIDNTEGKLRTGMEARYSFDNQEEITQ